MTQKHQSIRLPAALAVAAAIATCIASAVGAQVVDHDKVIADPQLDYRKYSKEITANESAERAHQDSALSAVRNSVGEDEASFQASLAATAQSLNAAATAGGSAASADASAAPLPAEAPHPVSIGIWIAVAAAGLVAVLLAMLGVSSLGGRKSRRRRRHQPEEKSARLVDFARKTEAEKTPDE